MRIVTRDEAEELTEHLSSRSDIWTLHEGVWLRSLSKDVYALALRISNGLPDGLYGIVYKTLSWQEETSSEYVSWLLDKYTAYSMRQKVVGVLRKHGLQPLHIEALSLELCELHGGPFLRKHDKSPREKETE